MGETVQNKGSAIYLLASDLWLFDFSNLATGVRWPLFHSGTPSFSEMEFTALYVVCIFKKQFF